MLKHRHLFIPNSDVAAHKDCFPTQPYHHNISSRPQRGRKMDGGGEMGATCLPAFVSSATRLSPAFSSMSPMMSFALKMRGGMSGRAQTVFHKSAKLWGTGCLPVSCERRACLFAYAIGTSCGEPIQFVNQRRVRDRPTSDDDDLPFDSVGVCHKFFVR